ncbi:unnamed protein product [Ixodes pacificus]
MVSCLSKQRVNNSPEHLSRSSEEVHERFVKGPVQWRPPVSPRRTAPLFPPPPPLMSASNRPIDAPPYSPIRNYGRAGVGANLPRCDRPYLRCALLGRPLKSVCCARSVPRDTRRPCRTTEHPGLPSGRRIQDSDNR